MEVLGDILEYAVDLGYRLLRRETTPPTSILNQRLVSSPAAALAMSAICSARSWIWSEHKHGSATRRPAGCRAPNRPSTYVPSLPDGAPGARSLTLCAAAYSAATTTSASAIVAFSELGRTARLISKQRPAAPILAFTPFEEVRRQMALYWGVLPHTMQQINQTDERMREAERRLKAEGLVKSGERIVILSGTQIGQPGGTNLIKLQEVE